MAERVLPPRPGAGTVPAQSGAAATFARRRQEYQARQLFELRTLTEGVSGEYDPNDTFGDNLSDFLHVADLSRTATLGDRSKKFKDAYPDGQLAFVPVGEETVLLARKSPQVPFRRLGSLARMSGAIVSEPVIIGAGASILSGGVATPFGVAAAAGGTLAGEIAKDEIERARGYESRPRSTTYTESLTGGAVGGIAELVTRGVLGKVIPIAGLSRKAQEVRLAQEFAEKEGLPPLMEGQVTESLPSGAAFAQAARVKGYIGERAAEQKIASREFLRSRVGRTSLTDSEVERTLHHLASDIDAFLSNITPATKTEAGNAIQKSMQDFQELSLGENGLLARKMNDLVQGSDDFAYNISGLKNAAAEIKLGTAAKAQQVRGKGGKFESGGNVRLEGPLNKELASVVDDLEKLPNIVSGFQDKGASFTAVEQLMALRTRLFNLKLSDFKDQELAARLHSQVVDIMSQPLTGNKLVAQRFSKVAGQYQAAEEVLERTYVRRILASDTPEKLLSLVKPGNTTAVQEIKRLVGKDQWSVVRNNFISELASAPKEIQAKLATWKMDPDGLRTLISPQEEQALLRYADLSEQLNMDVLGVAMKNGTPAEKRALTLLKANDESIAKSVANSGGPDGQVGVALRSVLIEDILEKATIRTKFGELLDYKAFSDEFTKARGLKKYDAFMRPEDWEELANLDRYMLFSSSIDDKGIGPSLQLAEEVSSAVKGIIPGPKSPGRLVRFGHYIVRQGTIARVMARPAARRGLAAAEAGEKNVIKGLAVGGALAMQEYRNLVGSEQFEEVEKEFAQ